jgi:hypothetical protein
VLKVGAGGVPGRGGVGSEVRILPRAGGGAPVPLRLQCVCRIFAVPFQKEGNQKFGSDEALPGVFVLHPSPFHAQETKHPACSLLGPRGVVS